MSINVLNTISFSGELLLKMKNEKQVPADALEALRKTADRHLMGEVFAVTKRNTRAVTGNPHDYASVGPYWWPNPDTPDGLPYVRRDGEIIPGSIEDITPRLMARRVIELALAAFYFDDENYGRAAKNAICAWHLDPDTCMNPHAEYAQAIPGICTGRGIGIIDFAYSYQVFDAVAILQYLGYIDDETVLKLKRWYTEFTDWMLTSENALTEDTELNNHGTFFDVQLLSMAVFTGREALIKKICTTAYARRFKSQIEPDGKQPLELARTMAMHYSLCNIRGLCVIANIAKRYGYNEYFEPDSENGVCLIKAAVDYLYPYVLDPKSFPYTESYNDEVYPTIPDMTYMILSFMNAHFEGYEEKLKTLPGVTSFLLRPAK